MEVDWVFVIRRVGSFSIGSGVGLLIAFVVAPYLAGFISAAVADFRKWRNGR